jgi:transposase-like protein
MDKTLGFKYLKRTQRDYSYSFKMQVVAEIESGGLSQGQAKKKYGIQSGSTLREWLRKFGSFDRTYELNLKKMKSPEQRILELEQQLKLLEKKNKSLERQLEQTDKKVIFFDMMIDMAEAEFKIPIRKKSLPGQSTNSGKNTGKP